MKPIHFSPPFLMEEDIVAVTDVLRSGWITSGAVGEEFRKKLEHVTCAHSIMLTNSATAALFSALKMMGIGEGDEVITTPYTFVATANVIYHTGAKIVLADVSPGSFFINSEEIYKKISPKTKAIILVDFSTASAIKLDKKIIGQFFHPKNSYQESLGAPLVLVDAAHALGSRILDSSVDMAVYSFHAVKNLTTAEGGALAINSFGSDELDKNFLYKLNAFILHGQDRSARDKFVSGTWEYDVILPGYKFNMPDILAALGLSQLKRYETEILPKRRQLFLQYMELLGKNARMILDEPAIFRDVNMSSCHLFPLRINGITEEIRNKVIQYCHEQQVFVNVHYKPLTMMTVVDHYGCSGEDMPHSYHQYCNEISLPLHNGMSLKDVEIVVEVLLKGLSNECSS